jgi:hypothetical protein
LDAKSDPLSGAVGHVSDFTEKTISRLNRETCPTAPLPNGMGVKSGRFVDKPSPEVMGYEKSK